MPPKQDARHTINILHRLQTAWGTDSDAALARALGVTRAAVSHVRQGRQPLPTHWLHATYLEKGVCYHWLWTGEGAMICDHS